MANSLRYAVLIVNFNTASFVAKAIESILRCATSDDFMIFVVDNASKESDRALLRTLARAKVHVVEQNRNGGYAVGYNAAAKLARAACDPAFLVIMNPDVEIVRRGTIETLIDCISLGGAEVVGAQPLIHAHRLPRVVTEQPAIRRVPEFWDLVIAESILLRYVFRRRFARFLMEDARPYDRNTRFLVPSGAFFAIDAKAFFEIGGFDEGTFLYGEEYILGKKLERIRKWFLFEPSVMVRHYQGASTGYDRWGPKRRMHIHKRTSDLYYLRKYLNGGRIKRCCLWVAAEFGYLIRFFAWTLLTAVQLIKRGRRS